MVLLYLKYFVWWTCRLRHKAEHTICLTRGTQNNVAFKAWAVLSSQDISPPVVIIDHSLRHVLHTIKMFDTINLLVSVWTWSNLILQVIIWNSWLRFSQWWNEWWRSRARITAGVLPHSVPTRMSTDNLAPQVPISDTISFELFGCGIINKCNLLSI